MQTLNSARLQQPWTPWGLDVLHDFMQAEGLNDSDLLCLILLENWPLPF
jgi:hypothetical protein